MVEVDSDWEELPSYYELGLAIQEFLVKTYHETFVEPPKSSSVESSWRYYTNFTLNDLLWIILFSILWKILRHLATEKVFKPLGYRYDLTPRNQTKMPESAWKFVYTLGTWSYTFYIIVLRYKLLQKPSTVWDNWNLEEPLPTDMYFLFMANYGYYIQAIYATLYLDIWRKDSLAMMIHHTAALLLLFIAFSLRYHKVGCLTLFLLQATDIILEFGKLNIYFRTQGGIHIQKHEILGKISLVLFLIAWYVTRLLWFPLKSLYSITAVVQKKQFDLKGALFLNSLGWILQILNIYWFLIILQLLYRIVTGQIKEIEDNREYDVAEKFQLESQRHKNKNVKTKDSCDDSSVSNEDSTGKVENTSKKEE